MRKIEVIFEAKCENAEAIEKIIKKSANAVLDFEGANGGVCITVVDNERIREINAEYRSIDKATDVLSFPALDGSEYDLTDGFIGDIAISYERAVEQANDYGHSVEREVSFLTVHGMLHILGYDHIEKSDEEEMFNKQREILNSMGVGR